MDINHNNGITDTQIHLTNYGCEISEGKGRKTRENSYHFILSSQLRTTSGVCVCFGHCAYANFVFTQWGKMKFKDYFMDQGKCVRKLRTF